MFSHECISFENTFQHARPRFSKQVRLRSSAYVKHEQGAILTQFFRTDVEGFIAHVPRLTALIAGEGPVHRRMHHHEELQRQIFLIDWLPGPMPLDVAHHSHRAWKSDVDMWRKLSGGFRSTGGLVSRCHTNSVDGGWPSVQPLLFRSLCAASLN